MKKKIIFLIVIIILVAALMGCGKKENNIQNNTGNEPIVEVKNTNPLNERYNLEDSINTIKSEIVVNAVEISDSEVVKLYNMGELSYLKKKVLIDSQNNNYEEIAVMKLTEKDQKFKLQKIMNDRYQALKEEYGSNAEVSKILNNSDNVKIKVQDDVAIFVISTRATKLIETLDKDFQL